MNIAVIFAGGIGSRMSSKGLPKQFLESSGKPIIIHTLEHFENHPEIDGIAIAILPEWREHLINLVNRYGITKAKWIVDGGETGQASRHNALKAVARDCPKESIVLIHDGVRPLINAKLISDNIQSVVEHGSGITCTKCNETIIQSEDHIIDMVIPREKLFIAQAPQSFHLGEILGLYDKAVADGLNDTIDSCSLMYRYNKPVYRVDGIRSNIKITTAEDFYIFRTFCQIIENEQIAGI